MNEPDHSASSSRFAELLAGIGLDPVLIGAHAANIYRATPRFTTDVDFLTTGLDGVEELAAREGLEVRFMADAGEPPHAAFLRGHDVRVDILAALTDYQLTVIERAVDGVATVEDVIIHKLIAWRSRDRDDIDQILIAEPTLDDAYLNGWVEAWQVADRWADCMRRHGR